jgi:hypothetical protein
MIDFNNNIYLGVASPNMERDLSNYYTKAQTRALVDTKQDIITGAASTITDSNLTANRAVISNGSGKVAVSNVTSTELGYLSGVTSEVQTQLNNKASTSLDNLSADGQMIIDSQNGTISNCILDIPQNLKIEIDSSLGVVVKAGSVITLDGSTYSTYTTTTDKVQGNPGRGRRVLFIQEAGGYNISSWNIENVVSGATDSLAGQVYHLWFDTTNKEIKAYTTDGNTVAYRCSYPLCIIDVDEDNNISFVKDSNGNDMIFNGAGFIGHHAFVYPNISILEPDGFNDDGTLKSIKYVKNNLSIIECKSNTHNIYISSISTAGLRKYEEYEYISDITNAVDFSLYYISSENKSYGYANGVYSKVNRTNFIILNSNGTTVTDFTIRQPVRTATVEMVDKKQADLTTVSGYNATTTQTLKHINGILTWVTEE